MHLLGENQAKRVLRAGLAGPRHRVGSASEPVTTSTSADPLSAHYQEQLDAEREEKRLYSTARHRSLARELFAQRLG